MMGVEQVAERDHQLETWGGTIDIVGLIPLRRCFPLSKS